MKMRQFLAAASLLGALLVPSLASAQSVAYAVGGMNMRAGPGVEYPVVAIVAAGSAVNVYGCISGAVWCDSSVQGVRGWLGGERLEFVYSGRRVLVPSYYTYFRAPVISFDFGYWDRYYTGRTFYRDRSRYGDRRAERREDRQDAREERQEDRQDVRQERQEDRKDTRVERRDERGDRQRCLDRGGTAAQCRQ